MIQLGFSLTDLDLLTVGELLDVLIERGNDDYKYPLKGTTETLDAMFGI
jgi:hypothetical protein